MFTAGAALAASAVARAFTEVTPTLEMGARGVASTFASP